MQRYLALIFAAENRPAAALSEAITRRLSHEPDGWRVAYRSIGALVIGRDGLQDTNLPQRGLLSAGRGIIVGTLFRRLGAHSYRQCSGRFSEHETARITATQARVLIDEYWGNYVAFLKDDSAGGYHVLRDPTGNLSCYRTVWNGIDVFYAQVADCLRFMPIHFSFDWSFIRVRLMLDQLLARSCGLSEVEDLPGGELLTLRHGAATRAVLWDPAEICRQSPIEDAARAATELRSSVQSVVACWASCAHSIIHSLSGGLDSSIIAGCLAQAPSKPRVSCFNFYTLPGPADDQDMIPGVDHKLRERLRRQYAPADERRLARQVAERWGYRLIEHERRAREVDLARVCEAPLAVSPSNYVDVVDLDDAESRLVRECDAKLFFNGLAGDTMLYVSSEPIGFIDYLYRHGLGRRIWSELRNACELSREAAGPVLLKAFKYGWRAQPMPETYDPLKRANFLTTDAVAAVRPEQLLHPWSERTLDLPPGKVSHVQGLVGALFYQFQFHREQDAQTVIPFAAQPVVETSLRIPSYVLSSDGVSRGLARRAFRDLLPEDVRRRLVKGAGGPFYQTLLLANMRFIREMLLGGLLVEQRILDPDKLSRCLDPEQRFDRFASSQISSALATEAWLRQWTDLAHRQRSGTSLPQVIL